MKSKTVLILTYPVQTTRNFYTSVSLLETLQPINWSLYVQMFVFSVYCITKLLLLTKQKCANMCTTEQNYSTHCNITIERFKRIIDTMMLTACCWSGRRVAGVSVHQLGPVAGTNGRIKQQSGVAAVPPHLPWTLQSLLS